MDLLYRFMECIRLRQMHNVVSNYINANSCYTFSSFSFIFYSFIGSPILSPHILVKARLIYASIHIAIDDRTSKINILCSREQTGHISIEKNR